MSDEVPLQELQEVGRVELRQGPTYLFRDDDATNSGLPIIVGLNEVVAISCVFGFLSMNNNTNSPSVGSDDTP